MFLSTFRLATRRSLTHYWQQALLVSTTQRHCSTFFYSSSEEERRSGSSRFDSGGSNQYGMQQEHREFRVEVSPRGNAFYSLENVPEYVNLLRREIEQVRKGVPLRERETYIPRPQNLMALYFQNREEIDFKYRIFKTMSYEYMKYCNKG